MQLLKTLLEACQKLQEQSFWEVIDYFVLLTWIVVGLRAMAEAQVAENHRDESDFTWYLLWGIGTSIPTWTNSQNLEATTEVSNLKISFYGMYSSRSSQSPQK